MMVFTAFTLVEIVPGKQAAIFVYPSGIAGNKIQVKSGFFVDKVLIASFAASQAVKRSVPTGR